MKIRVLSLLRLFFILSLLIAACNQAKPPAPTSTPTAAPAQPTATQAAQATDTPAAPPEEPLYLAIIWHQHQPVYYKDPATGVYAKPWVRMHAIKDYVDMAAMLKNYPGLHVTFNLTPSLLRQVDDLSSGTKDFYWVAAETPAGQLTAEQKQFLLDRFFDTNRKIIARFPRYQELLSLRDSGGVYNTQDYLDLQLLFNLAWTDPDWLVQEPLAGLVAKGRSFSEEDKKTLFTEQLRLIRAIVPLHKELQDAGQIEVTMTPFAHPILPLLVNTDLAKIALPDLALPNNVFSYPQDAVAQLELGVQLYQDHFGQAPRGMWPAEGSVAQDIVGMVSQAGVQWMASDEGVLAESLGMPGFSRNAQELVLEADPLYRPYYVQDGQGAPVAMVFRDVVISDKVGFAYSSLPGETAANDFINRLHAIREALKADEAGGPHLVSVILDGENAWENYANDGKDFLNSLYEKLSADQSIQTVTPSEYLALFPDQPKIEKLWAGSWISHDFSTWIGEDEENRAWDYLFNVRSDFEKYASGEKQASPEALQQAQTLMYIAEGSDWFWWYGADQNSGGDESFDRQYRDTLKGVYTALGAEAPLFLDAPIIAQQAVGADVASSGLIAPKVDGQMEAGEWDAAGVYNAAGGAMAAAMPYFQSVAYGFDSQTLYFKLTRDPKYSSLSGADTVEIYLAAAGNAGAASPFSRNQSLLGFNAAQMAAISLADGKAVLYQPNDQQSWEAVEGELSVGFDQAQGVFELGIPLDLLGKPKTGDRISLRAVHVEPLSGLEGASDTDLLPAGGPAVINVPDLTSMTAFLNVDDPANDDTGPGTYTYPQDSVYKPGNFDILNFQVGSDGESVVFKLTLRGPVDNPWGSPNGLALQTFDIYIDQDGGGQGAAVLLPGRNLALQEGYAWDYAITAEGWEAGVFKASAEGPQRVGQSSEVSILVDPGQQKVTIRVPKTLLGENPESWQYAAMVMSQEGYPSAGVMRIRDGQAAAAQWRFGGIPEGATNYTRIFDLAWPEAGKQEEWLSAYPPSKAAQADLTAADFAKIPMLAVK